MPQVTNGIILAAPGPAGSAPVSILVDVGAAASSSDPAVAACAPGSLYIKTDYPLGLFQKQLDGTWLQIS